jgi:hypothetical protein
MESTFTCTGEGQAKEGYNYQCALQSIQHFLDNPHILEYVAQLGSQKLEAGGNWFTRVETTMLADMLKLLRIVLPATVSVPMENHSF